MSDPIPPSAARVRQAVPFFVVTDMDESLRYYVDGLGFQRTRTWVVDERIRWCWLRIDDAAIMLQQYFRDGAPWKPGVKLGEGVSVCFMCEDAVAYWRVLRARGVAVSRPFVGNNLWVASLSDPDGYRLDFESPTDVPEETEWEGD